MNVLLNKLADDDTYGEVSVLVEQILNETEFERVGNDLNDLLKDILFQLNLLTSPLTSPYDKFQKLLEKIESHLQSS